jgi:ABC-type phosphate transport system substrate-binding protein
VGDIFSGDVRNWQSVSGPDEAIVVVRKILGWSPDFFRRKVLGDREFAAEAVKVEHTEEVVAEVSRQPWAVGFSDLEKSIPAQDQIRLLRLVDDTSGEDATYAMRRPLFFFTRADSPQVQAFVDFVLGSDAQAKTFEVGLYPAQEADSVPDR